MKTDKEKLDTLLCVLDDDAIAQGEPPLSCLVRHDDGAVSTAFWRTVEKYNLRLPNESDDACVKRHIEMAFKWGENK